MDDNKKEKVSENTSYRFVIEIIMFLTYAAFGAAWASCGIFLKEIMKDLSLTLSQASFITTSVSFAKIFGPALAGFISYRLGLRWSFMLASALICLGILAPVSPNFGLLLLARFGMGIGGAMVIVYFSPMIMQWFSEKERVVINGVNFVAINTGMMAGMFATAPLMKLLGGSWKNALIFYGVISMALALMWLIFGREKEVKKQDAVKRAEENKSPAQCYMEEVKNHYTWKLAFTYVGALAFYLVLFTYFPMYYQTVMGFAKNSLASMSPAIAMCVGIPSSLIGIELARRTGLRIPFIRYSGIVLIPAILGMILFKNPVMIVASAVVTGFCLFLGTSSFFSIPLELEGVTVKKVGSMMSVFWSICYIAATFIVWYFGKIVEAHGYMPAFIFITAISSMYFIGTFMLPETGPGKKK
ncbi:MAG: MFS transporter [Candidatus Omnitrophota bacterium]